MIPFRTKKWLLMTYKHFTQTRFSLGRCVLGLSCLSWSQDFFTY